MYNDVDRTRGDWYAEATLQSQRLRRVFSIEGRKPGVSNSIFAVVVIVIIAVAAVAAYGAYDLGGAGRKTKRCYPIQREYGSPPSLSTTTSASTMTSSTSTGLPSGAIPISDAMALMQAPLTGATVSQSSDSITFTSPSSISITAFAMTQENATRTTGMHPPSYAQGDAFVIGGLIDPTLYIPTGASVTFTIVNMDNAMYNDLVVSTVGPPFASNMSQYMTWNGYGMGMMAGSGFQGFLYMMSVLSPANYAGGWVFTYSYTVMIPSYANLWYVCTYPGHGNGRHVGRDCDEDWNDHQHDDFEHQCNHLYDSLDHQYNQDEPDQHVYDLLRHLQHNIEHPHHLHLDEPSTGDDVDQRCRGAPEDPAGRRDSLAEHRLDNVDLARHQHNRFRHNA